MVLFLGVIGLAGLVVWLYSLFEVITTPSKDVRTLPKPSWIAVVALFFIFGAIAWMLTGRPRTEAVSSTSHARLPPPGQPTGDPQRGERQRPPLGPDDDPEFLRRLNGPDGDEEGDDRNDSQP